MKKLLDFNAHNSKKDIHVEDLDKYMASLIINDIDLEDNSQISEGILGGIIGGLSGVALGRKIGEFLIKQLNLQQGTILYNLFTSKMFFMTAGYIIGKNRNLKA